MITLSVYEQPLNERIRLLMRLESMFKQMRLFHQAKDYYEIQLFLDALFDVLDFLHRYEIRSELIKELQRYKTVLIRGSGELNMTTIEQATMTADIDQHLHAVHEINFNIISALRENELFNSLRQRSFHQSGNCLFEVPAYQYWLVHRDEQETSFLDNCYQRFLAIEQSVELILHLVRTSNKKIHARSEDAMYVRTLDNNQMYQMIRIHVPQYVDAFPRVSGDKHRFAIRFMRQNDPNQRAIQLNTPIEFDLQICTA